MNTTCQLIYGIIFQLSTRSPPTDRTATRTTATTEATATPGPPASDVDAAVTLATDVGTNHLYNRSLKSLTSLHPLCITSYYDCCNTLKSSHDTNNTMTRWSPPIPFVLVQPLNHPTINSCKQTVYKLSIKFTRKKFFIHS